MVLNCLKKLCRKKPKYIYDNPDTYTYSTPAFPSQPPFNFNVPLPTSAPPPIERIHKALDANRSNRVWWFNMHRPPFPARIDPYELNPRGYEITHEPATTPPCRQMKIICDDFPLSILVVEASARIGYIRVGDVLQMIYEYMQQLVEEDETSLRTPTDRTNPVYSFRRVHCIGKRTKFVGLTRVAESMWRMELSYWTRGDSYI